jgi:hypothetical protein
MPVAIGLTLADRDLHYPSVNTTGTVMKTTYHVELPTVTEILLGRRFGFVGTRSRILRRSSSDGLTLVSPESDKWVLMRRSRLASKASLPRSRRVIRVEDGAKGSGRLATRCVRGTSGCMYLEDGSLLAIYKLRVRRKVGRRLDEMVEVK